MTRRGIVALLTLALALGPGCGACCTDQLGIPEAHAGGGGGGSGGWGHLNFGSGGGGDAGAAVVLVVVGGILAVALLWTLADAAVRAATPDDYRCEGDCCASYHAVGDHRGCHCSRACPCWAGVQPGP